MSALSMKKFAKPLMQKDKVGIWVEVKSGFTQRVLIELACEGGLVY
jgi:hypothetical protein